jgi:hypothetical protein
MLITIRVNAVGPPSGELVVDQHESQPFAGWLELLGILTGVLASPDESPGVAHRLGGQLHPGAETEFPEDV